MTPTLRAAKYSACERDSASIRTIDALERIAAAIALMALLPALAVFALVTAVLSRRGPLVRHTRAGLQREPLHMLKLRTMWGSGPGSVGVLGDLFEIEDISDAVPACKGTGDKRVKSRFAAFCRKYSIDELPQLYHVVRGEMSLVGPRPVTLGELERHYEGFIDEVLSIRPGMTGLWQVRGRNQLSYLRRRRLDLIYVRRRSAGLYFRILLRSVPRVLSGTGC